MTVAKRKPPTREQKSYHDAAAALGCVVCAYRKCSQPNRTTIHHRNLDDKHGQKQLGQDFVVSMCQWHHQGVPILGWKDDEMREEYGPSFQLHARDFREWTFDALPQYPGRGTERWQAYQDYLLQGKE